MNKWGNSGHAIEELKKGTIEILNDEETRELNKLLLKCKTKDELIFEMKTKGYSEFIVGVQIGIMLITEAKLKKRGFMERFRKNG